MQLTKTSPANLEQSETLQDSIADLYSITSVTLDRPQAGHIRFRGFFQCDLATCYDELRQRFEEHGFTPFIREEEGQPALIAAPVVFDPPPSNWLVNLALLVATILSTLYIGALTELAAQESFEAPGLSDLLLGWPYSLSLMLILGAHELGHYFAARYHKVPVTLPYFFPFPLPPIGTFGAFIRLKAPIKNRRALFDVGAAGPLAGLVFAIPILLIGLQLSPIEPLPPEGCMLCHEGNSVIYAMAKFIIKGRLLPSATDDVLLGQVAWAGWVGLLVTGLNLLPVGQLDGGHVSYVLFGKRARRFFWPVIAGLVVIGLLTRTGSWTLWVVLLFFFGRRHAEPLDDVTPLDGRRRLLAIATLLLFFLVFVPVPLSGFQPLAGN